MSVRSRLAKLEQVAAGQCPECGHGGPIALAPIVFDADGNQVLGPEPPPGPCGTCGRARFRFFPVTFDGDKQINATEAVEASE